MQTPFDVLHPYYYPARPEGRLTFEPSDPAYAAYLSVSGKLPTIAVVDMERGTKMSQLQGSNGLIAAFGVSDGALLAGRRGLCAMKGVLP